MNSKTIKKLVIVVLLVLIFSIVDYLMISLTLKTDTLEVEVGQEYSLITAKATSFNRDITDKIKIINNVDINTLGTYTIDYKAYGLITHKTKKVTVTVVDKTAPTIKLQGSYYQPVNTEYQELGYIVSDNYDASEDITVEISSDVDFNFTEGEYEVEYKAIDQSGNVSYAYRTVAYDPDYDQRSFSLTDFSIEDMSNILKTNKTQLTYDDIADHFLFVGDSIIRDMGYNHVLPGESVAAYPCLGPENVMSTVCTYNNDENNWMNVPTILMNDTPDNLVINFGICTLETNSFADSLYAFETMLNVLPSYSHNTKIYVASILPTLNDEVGNKPTNATINAFNYYLAKICADRKIEFINVASVLKGDDGYGNPDYYVSDGYHLNEEGEQVYYDYMINHLYQ